MTYNIHPIIVHFPVALLFLYSFIKIVPFKKWIPSFSWDSVLRALLFFGILGAFAAYMTGDTARALFGPSRSIVEAHESFASISIFIYTVLLIREFLPVFKAKYFEKIKSEEIKKIILLVEKVLTQKALSKILAFLGLVSITITGMLGGIMVYGLSADPIAPLVLKILGLQL